MPNIYWSLELIRETLSLGSVKIHNTHYSTNNFGAYFGYRHRSTQTTAGWIHFGRYASWPKQQYKLLVLTEFIAGRAGSDTDKAQTASHFICFVLK